MHLRQIISNMLTTVTPQDQQGWRPHVTVQNKVAGKTARALFDELGAAFEERAGSVEALLLWEYRGGPWAFIRRLAFE